MPEEKVHHRVHIDMTKVDHFVEFINRPYFYQDECYGTKFLKLDGGNRNHQDAEGGAYRDAVYGD